MEQKHSEQFYNLVHEQLYILSRIWFTRFLFVRLSVANMQLHEFKKKASGHKRCGGSFRLPYSLFF